MSVGGTLLPQPLHCGAPQLLLTAWDGGCAVVVAVRGLDKCIVAPPPPAVADVVARLSRT